MATHYPGNELRSRGSRRNPRRPRRLGYKDARELEQLPARIEALEAQLAALTGRMYDPAFYRRDGAAIAAHNAEMAALQQALDEAYARWEALERSVG